MSDDATVADVLREVCPDECWQMIDYIEMEDICQPGMGYEAWVRPLKLTGGRVCLRADAGEDAPTDYYTVDGDLLKVRDTVGWWRDGPEAMDWLKTDMRDPVVDLTPVLREDTPFAEVDDGR